MTTEQLSARLSKAVKQEEVTDWGTEEPRRPCHSSSEPITHPTVRHTGMYVQKHARANTYTPVLPFPRAHIFRCQQKKSILTNLHLAENCMWIRVIALSRYCSFNKIKLFFFSVLNKWWRAGISYISACQQWLGQACDLWPLTVKLTLPPVRCCAKCQERPLILSCSLVSCSVAEYLSGPDQCTYIPSSAQISLLQAVLHRDAVGQLTYSVRMLHPPT